MMLVTVNSWIDFAEIILKPAENISDHSVIDEEHEHEYFC